MKSATVGVFGLVLSLATAILNAQTVTFDAAAEFGSAPGTLKTWQYGWSENVTTSLLAYHAEQFSVPTGGGTQSALGTRFESPEPGIYVPNLTFNPTDTTIDFFGGSHVSYRPHELTLHPGYQRQQAVLQWTAPAAGLYKAELSLEGADSVDPSVTVSIVVGTNVITHGDISGFGSRYSWTEAREFAAGETFSVRVGNLVGDFPAYDSTRVVAARMTYFATDSTTPVILQAPQNQAVLSGSDVQFGVRAFGTGPLSYQWQFNQTNIDGATNSSLALNAVQRTDAGNYGVVVCSPTGCAQAVAATLLVNPRPPTLRIAATSVKSPQIAEVPLILEANGSENALSFSLRFDASILTFQDLILGSAAEGGQLLVNAARASNGVVSVALALPAGQVFAESTNTVLTLLLETKTTLTGYNAALSFSDTPIAEKVTDTFGKVIPSNFHSGILTILATDYEADLNPVPAGDKNVDISDWVQVGRYVAGLDELNSPGLFQRADCAPRETSGNGILTVSDWVQAGRYAAQLDPLIPVGGPTEPIALPSRITGKPRAATSRAVKIQSTTLLYGRTNEISVHMTAQGDENALAFSLNFDPKLLRYLGASVGTHTLGAQLNLNAKQAGDGHVGLALALATGKPLTAGEKEVAKLRFATLSPVPAAGGLGFGDLPIIREIASVTAESLPVTWQSQALTVISPNLSIVRDPASGLSSIQLSWPAAYSNAQLESASEPNPTAWIQIPVSPTTANGINTVSIPLTEANSYYRLKVP